MQAAKREVEEFDSLENLLLCMENLLMLREGYESQQKSR